MEPAELARTLEPYLLRLANRAGAAAQPQSYIWRWHNGSAYPYAADAGGLVSALAAAVPGDRIVALGLVIQQAITIPPGVALVGWATTCTATVSLSAGSRIEGLTITVEDDYTTVIALLGPTDGLGEAHNCTLRAAVTTVGQAKAAFGRPGGTLRLTGCTLAAKYGAFDLLPVTLGNDREVQVVSFNVEAGSPNLTHTPFKVLPGCRYRIEARGDCSAGGPARLDAQWRSPAGDYSDRLRGNHVMFAGLTPTQPEADDSSYHPNHVYPFTLTGATGTLGARIIDPDGSYSANSGVINVEIWLECSAVEVEGCTFLAAAPNPSGAGRALWGDRAAWDAQHFPAHHANDVNAGEAAIHHTIGSGYGQVAAGSHNHPDPNRWGISVPALADEDADSETIYFSTTQSALVYKDENDVIRVL